MSEIHIFGGRAYAARTVNGRSTGMLVSRDELALLGSDDVAAITQSGVVGAQSYVDTGSITLTSDGRLRTDTRPTDETVNPFAAPSPWASKSPWSSKSAW